MLLVKNQVPKIINGKCFACMAQLGREGILWNILFRNCIIDWFNSAVWYNIFWRRRRLWPLNFDLHFGLLLRAEYFDDDGEKQVVVKIKVPHFPISIKVLITKKWFNKTIIYSFQRIKLTKFMNNIIYFCKLNMIFISGMAWTLQNSRLNLG